MNIRLEKKILRLILHEAITVPDKNIVSTKIHVFMGKGRGRVYETYRNSKTCPGGRLKRTIS